MAAGLLTGRRKSVLEALVSEYISSAAPVPSRVICEQYGLGVSPATVRNELASLEETGYVISPHTSAGRVPTDTGYRTYVDDLLARGGLLFDEKLASGFVSDADEVDDLLQEATIALVEFTHCLAVLLGPVFKRVVVGRISLMKLSSNRLMIVVMTQDGRIIDTQHDCISSLETYDLVSAEKTLNGLLAGKSVEDILTMDVLDGPIEAGDRTARECLDDIHQLLREGVSSRIHQRGVSALLRQPEFRNADQAIPIVSVLEDNLAMLSLFGGALDAEAPVVFIGHENRSASFESVSVVAKGYQAGGGQGIVAVIGPTRMDYARAISGVSTAARVLGETF